MRGPRRTLAATALAVALGVLGGCAAADAPSSVVATAGGVAPESIEVSGETRPTLSWNAVDGAAAYRVTVVQQDGPPWAWEGVATRVVVGGGETEDRVGPGFELTGSATATVYPLDADGTPLGFRSVELGT